MSGEKHTIVLLQGWGFDVKIWEPVINAYQQNYNFISVNLLDLVSEQDEQNIEIFVKRLDPLVPVNAILLGWSLGGLIASYYCCRYPHKNNRLITVNSSPKFLAFGNWPGISKDEITNFYGLAHQNFPQLLKRFVCMVAYPQQDKSLFAYLQLLTQPIAEKKLLILLSLLMQCDARNALGALAVPSLHILGAQDAVVPVTVADNLSVLNKLVRVKIIAEAGHAAFLTHQQLCWAAVESFVRECRA